jgi:hypothetical protein
VLDGDGDLDALLAEPHGIDPPGAALNGVEETGRLPDKPAPGTARSA